MPQQPLSLPDGFILPQQPKHVLYMGKDTDIFQTVLSLLNQMTIAVHRAETADLQLTPQQSYGFILLDLHLPDVDIVQLCTWFKRNEAYRDAPLVLLYNREETDAAKAAFNAGADDFIHLPVDPTLFLVRVKSLLTSTAWKDLALITKKRSLIVSQIMFGLNHDIPFAELLQNTLPLIVKHAEASSGAVMMLEHETLQQNWVAQFHETDTFCDMEHNILLQMLESKETVWLTQEQLMDGNATSGYAALFPVIENDSLYGVLVLLFDPSQNPVQPNLQSTAIICDMLSILVGRYYLQLSLDQHAQQLQHELKNLGRMQQLLLPSTLPSIDGFAMDAYYLPAHQSGGDYFDVFPLTNEHVAFVVADVSGHGAPAAMNMGIARSVLHTVSLSQETNPKNTVYFLNKLLCKLLGKGTYITLFYGILNIHTKEFTYCNAGHVPALLKQHRTQSVLHLGDPSNGPALGWWSDMEFEQEKVQLEEKDELLIYTDGVNEAHNETFEEYTIERLSSFIQQQTPSSPTTLIESIMNDVEQHIDGNELTDDIAILAIHVK